MQSHIRTLSDLTGANQSRMIELPPQPMDGSEIWIRELRNEARNRVRENSNQIPYIPNNLDARIIQNINSDDELSDFRTGIILNIMENRCDPGLAAFLIRNGGLTDLEPINRILNLTINYENYSPLINLLLLSITGDSQISGVISDLNVTMRGLYAENEIQANIIPEIREIRAETHENLDQNQRETEERLNTIHERGDNERSRIFSTIPWSTYMRRAGSLILSVGGIYYAGPLLGPLMTHIGARMLPPQLPTGNYILPNLFDSRPRWNEVSTHFYESWNLFFRFWG